MLHFIKEAMISIHKLVDTGKKANRMYKKVLKYVSIIRNDINALIII